MNSKLDYMLSELDKIVPGATNDSISKLEEQLSFKLPEDYISLMREFNGGEGEIGKNGWLCLFSISELLETNRNYQSLMSEIPDYFLFGKDAADTAYAFHKKNWTFHSFGFLSDFSKDFIEFCGNNLEEFIECLYNE